ncbi:MAG TPA: CocE/NonD family hydrolase [Terracidiphilus sp.]|nr:CocE/NonD family hydrolase [Terracidiphilus sp.]
MLKKILCLVAFAAAFAGAFLPGSIAQSQTSDGVIVEHNVAMKTRDGVTLYADVYRPASAESLYVLLKRTPYDKSRDEALGTKMAKRGYLVVIQDTRGRYTSEGEWYPFKHEINDGYDAVEWASALPHANGKVGMFSGSYVGATQMLAAIARPPHLAGICPVVTASNYHANWTYQGGAFEQWFDESWTTGLAQDTANRALKDASNALEGAKALPLTQYPVFNVQAADGTKLTRELAPYFLDWLAHPNYDGYWKQWSIEENYGNIQVPALVISAWYDLFQGGSIRNYLGIRAHGGTEAARTKTQLVVAIGGHSGFGRKVGELDFGPDAAFDEDAITLDWYDYLFKGKQNQFANGKLVKIFVMGENKWRDEANWPLERTQETRYSLHSDGKANSAAGDGVLSIVASRNEAADSYVYDPANPVPTVGGPLCCDTPHLAPGPRDQSQVEARPDVLVYSTPPLDRDTEVTGPITLDLYAKSSAVDTDFTGKLVDVGPDGKAYNLTEGILRARYRESMEKPTPIVPGKIYEYKIDLWSTSNVFLKGHRIRLEVSSSNFPRFDRNLNTGKSAAESAEFVKATNTILHDSEHPSAVILPIIPR